MHVVFAQVLDADGSKRADADVQSYVRLADPAFLTRIQKFGREVQAGCGRGNSAGAACVGGLIPLPVGLGCQLAMQVRRQRQRPEPLKQFQRICPDCNVRNPDPARLAIQQRQQQLLTARGVLRRHDGQSFANLQFATRLNDQFPGPRFRGCQVQSFPPASGGDSSSEQPRGDDLSVVQHQAIPGIEQLRQISNRLMADFPLMRGQTFYLLIAWVVIQFGMINSHAYAPNFPFGASMKTSIWFGVGVAILGFLSFNTWQAVVQTRDLHVESKHSHPDPRQMVQAMRDHSLIAWSVVLIVWGVFVVVNSWAGAHSVALRDPSALWPLRILYFLTGVASIFTMLHVLWFPQMMLGEAGETIESDRAREVSRGLRGEDSVVARQRGSCPSCSAVTAVSRLATGELEVTCSSESCDGIGKPSTRCPACAKVLPTRVACESCGTSAPVIDHLADEDAW